LFKKSILIRLYVLFSDLTWKTEKLPRCFVVVAFQFKAWFLITISDLKKNLVKNDHTTKYFISEFNNLGNCRFTEERFTKFSGNVKVGLWRHQVPKCKLRLRNRDFPFKKFRIKFLESSLAANLNRPTQGKTFFYFKKLKSPKIELAKTNRKVNNIFRLIPRMKDLMVVHVFGN
jgi:hypothetical protein